MLPSAAVSLLFIPLMFHCLISTSLIPAAHICEEVQGLGSQVPRAQVQLPLAAVLACGTLGLRTPENLA